MGEKTSASVAIDAGKLHLGDPARWSVLDAEAKGAAAPIAGLTVQGNTITVPVERHDYVQLIIEQK